PADFRIRIVQKSKTSPRSTAVSAAPAGFTTASSARAVRTAANGSMKTARTPSNRAHRISTSRLMTHLTRFLESIERSRLTSTLFLRQAESLETKARKSPACRFAFDSSRVRKQKRFEISLGVDYQAGMMTTTTGADTRCFRHVARFARLASSCELPVDS